MPLRQYPAERVIATLEPLLTERRVQRLRAVLAARSDHVAFVFEHMIDPHNFSAALRSLDAFSFQDAHLVHPGERLGVARGITIGSERWLSVHQAASTPECLRALRADGYRIYAGDLEGDAVLPLTGIDFSQRTALVYGNEHLGVSEDVRAQCDGRFRIDMLGFVESLNLSVAVAVSAFHARQELNRLSAEADDPQRFGLSAERRRLLYAHWLRLSARSSERILKEALGEAVGEAAENGSQSREG